MCDYTAIRVTKGTRDVLRRRGKKGDKYEDIVKTLIKEASNK